MMLIIGCIQIALGIFKIYNPEEIAFETTSIHPENNTIDTTEQEDALLEILTHKRERIEIYIQTLPEKQQQELIENMNTFLENTDPNENIPRFEYIEKIQEEPIQEVQTLSIEQTEAWYPNIIHRPDEDQSMLEYENNIIDTFLLSFFQSVLWKIDVFIDHERIHPRGQMKSESIILSSKIQSYDELVKVLVHELAHIYDIYFLKSGLTQKDPSHDFYAINWQDIDSQKAGSKPDDFLSGYGASNQYEDFAEAFTYYLFHSKDFAEKSKNNSVLQEKYTFLKNEVFGSFFADTAFEKEQIPDYVWDTTKIPLKDEARKTLFEQ